MTHPRATPPDRDLRQDARSLFSQVSNGAVVQIGNRADPEGDFLPQAHVSRWGGECEITLTAADVEPDHGNAPSWANGRASGRFRRQSHGQPRWEHHTFSKGSTEWEITWETANAVPDSGYVDFLIDAADTLTWHKQLPLTAQEIADGHIRPDNVINSYAAYWPKSGRIVDTAGDEIVNYATGKALHVYRPKLIDDDGAEQWCDQTIILPAPLRLRVYLDTAWLAGAAFPVTLDPDLGYTTAGGTTYQNSRIYVTGYNTTAGSDGTASALWVYTPSGSSGNCKMALYDAGDGGNRLTSSYEFVSPTANQWNSADCSGDAVGISNGVDYYPGYCMPASGHTVAYDSGSSGDIAGYTSSFVYANEMADPCTALASSSALRMSFYLEYVAGGATVPPLADHYYRLRRAC